MMEYYHNNFRQYFFPLSLFTHFPTTNTTSLSTWNQLYAACSPSSTSSSPTLPASRLTSLSLSFIQHLTIHHDIEEQHIFPILASRMSEFQPGAKALEQHKLIHAGLDRLEEYMVDVKRGERELRREEVKGILDAFGSVLWSHLEEEVQCLGAERMRRSWSREEIARLPM